MFVKKRAAVLLPSLAFVVAACAATKPQAELEPRYVAVHNTLVAMGLAETVRFSKARSRKAATRS